MSGEGFRFWFPIACLAGLAAWSSTKLIRAHVDPRIAALVPKYIFTQQLPARRGSVVSALGKSYPFAKSISCWEYFLDPVALTNSVVRLNRKEKPRLPEAIVKTVSDALGLDYRRTLKMSENKKNQYQRLTISSDPKVHDIIANRHLVAGVAIEDRQIRQYLHGRRLCHVLGAVNGAHAGIAGIELRYQKELAGTPGVVRGMKDADRHELYDKRITSIKPIDGADIHLTVDPNIQYEVEDAVKWGLREYGAGSGWSLVMDVRTGAILAMASFPDFEPLSFGRIPDDAKINRAIAYNYEPGSVMKVITAAAAIDSGMAGPNTVYRTNRDDPAYYKLPGDGSHVWEPTMTIRDAIVHSSNIVIGKLGYDLQPKRLWTYMRSFGFGDRTGIELPGEQYGILHGYQKWDKATWSRAAIGQGVSVTAIQLAGAYQAIGNDGLRMRPYLVERIVGPDGKETYRHRPEPLGHPITSATAKTLRNMMLDVASPKGTARRAAIPGYSIAGKTGTAQKTLGRGYAPGLYRATFCGIVPASDPRLVVLVTLDFDQKTLYHQGGNSAGPVFKRMTMPILRYLMSPPDRPEEVDDLEEDEHERIVEQRVGKF